MDATPLDIPISTNAFTGISFADIYQCGQFITTDVVWLLRYYRDVCV